MALTKKKLDFANEYFKTRNARKSAEFAGYSETFSKKRAYQLLEDLGVQAHIKELEDIYLDESVGILVLKSMKKLSDILDDDEITGMFN